MTTKKRATETTKESLEARFRTIDGLKAELERLGELPPETKTWLEGGFAERFTYNSNAIEGNRLSQNGVRKVLRGEVVPTMPLKDHIEIYGLHNAWRLVKAAHAEGRELDEDLVLEIHGWVLLDRPEERSRYRRVNVMVRGSNVTMPQHGEVPNMMRTFYLEDVLRDGLTGEKVHPIQSIARSHLIFERIHPFADGTGRTGRLMVNFMLMREGYLPIDITYDLRHDYYGAFQEYDRTESVEAMAMLIADYEHDSLIRRIQAYQEES